MSLDDVTLDNLAGADTAVVWPLGSGEPLLVGVSISRLELWSREFGNIHLWAIRRGDRSRQEGYILAQDQTKELGQRVRP